MTARVFARQGCSSMHGDTAASAGLMAGVGAYFVFDALVTVLAPVVNWRIASKAGYSGALSPLMLIPLANVIVLIVFAFSKWPIEQRLEARAAGGLLPSSSRGYEYLYGLTCSKGGAG